MTPPPGVGPQTLCGYRFKRKAMQRKSRHGSDSLLEEKKLIAGTDRWMWKQEHWTWQGLDYNVSSLPGRTIFVSFSSTLVPVLSNHSCLLPLAVWLLCFNCFLFSYFLIRFQLFLIAAGHLSLSLLLYSSPRRYADKSLSAPSITEPILIKSCFIRLFK